MGEMGALRLMRAHHSCHIFPIFPILLIFPITLSGIIFNTRAMGGERGEGETIKLVMRNKFRCYVPLAYNVILNVVKNLTVCTHR